MRKTTINVSYSTEGFHRWSEAPPERSYLKNLHRHLFKVTVEMSVDHCDREVEFHDLLEFIKLYSCEFCTNDLSSCEHHCFSLLEALEENYPNRKLSVSVSEDGECGATVKNYD